MFMFADISPPRRSAVPCNNIVWLQDSAHIMCSQQPLSTADFLHTAQRFHGQELHDQRKTCASSVFLPHPHTYDSMMVKRFSICKPSVSILDDKRITT